MVNTLWIKERPTDQYCHHICKAPNSFKGTVLGSEASSSTLPAFEVGDDDDSPVTF